LINGRLTSYWEKLWMRYADLSPGGRLATRLVGAHIFIGDRVMVIEAEGGGPIELGERTNLWGDSQIETGRGGEITIGAYTRVNRGVQIVSYVAPIRIGRDVGLGTNCLLYSYNHGIAPGRPYLEQPLGANGPIVIDDHAWIGMGSIILSGVHIGEHAVVAAGSVVHHDVPAGTAAAGNPARVGKKRPQQGPPEPPKVAGTNEHIPDSTGRFLLPRLRFSSSARSFAPAGDRPSGIVQGNRDALVPVLLYHNIGPFQRGTNPSVTISIEKFEEHIHWLKKHDYVGIRPSDWLSWLRGEKRLPHKAVMITFDDAFASLDDYALPLLEKYGFPSAVFVVTSWIGGTNRWGQRKYNVTLPCMTQNQIRKWAARGIEFGSPTRTHPDLTQLRDDDIAVEMQGSASDLSRLLGSRVCAFAYPYGDYSEAAKKQAQGTFDLAFTCEQGLNGFCTNPYLLRRLMLRPQDTLMDLILYARYGWSRRRARRQWRDLRTRAMQAWRDRVVKPRR
jgi:acetyltransferase-like isoleucine patch superfamily enzyme/peptidoglycan/xylan/chitin deacetylase (PgdA/CDA1 family)